MVIALPLLLVSAALGMSQECPDTDIISVRGVGRVSVKTTIAKVTLAVQSSGKSADVVQRDLANSATRLIRYLRNQRVGRLQTSGVSLFPVFTYRKGERSVSGFRGSNTISFKTSVRRAGPVLDGAIRNGANRVSSLSFEASAKAAKYARRRALQNAVRMARREATIVAKASGVKLGRAVSVRITDNFFPRPIRTPIPFRSSIMSRRRRPSVTPIIARNLLINARVEIRYDTGYASGDELGVAHY